jgi:hypothetical protein
MIPPGCRPRRSLSRRQYNFCVNAAPHHRRRQIAAPIWWASWLRMAGHLLSKGLLHGIRRNRRVSSLRRCRKLRRRHPRGLRHRPIDCLGSLSLPRNAYLDDRSPAPRATRRPPSRDGGPTGAAEASRSGRTRSETRAPQRIDGATMLSFPAFSTWHPCQLTTASSHGEHRGRTVRSRGWGRSPPEGQAGGRKM